MGKNPHASAGDVRNAGSIPGLGGCPGEGNGNPLRLLAWEILWTEEPGGLQSMGSQNQTRLSDSAGSSQLPPSSTLSQPTLQNPAAAVVGKPQRFFSILSQKITQTTTHTRQDSWHYSWLEMAQ